MEYSPHVIRAEKAVDFYIQLDFDPQSEKANSSLSDLTSSASIDIFDDRDLDFFYNQ